MLDKANPAKDLAERIRMRGGQVSYRLPDYHSLLETLGIGAGQQNLVFRTLRELGHGGVIQRQTVKVSPPETYDAGSRPDVNVREVIYTLR